MVDYVYFLCFLIRLANVYLLNFLVFLLNSIINTIIFVYLIKLFDFYSFSSTFLRLILFHFFLDSFLSWNLSSCSL